MPLSLVDVQQALDGLGAGVQVRVLETCTATAKQAAESIGVPLGSIVKSLCFVVDGQAVVVLAAGDRKVAARKLAERFGVTRKRVRIADADTTIAMTGYAPGGVPPVGHAQPLPVLIDASLARFEIVHAAAGSPNAIFSIRFAELARITAGEMLDLTES